MPDTLKNIIADEMKAQNVTQKDMQIRTNGRVKQGNLSAALKGTRHFTLDALDAITSALNYPFGHFYPYYISECKDVDGNRMRAKSKDFIVKCNEIGQAHLAENLISDMVQEGPVNADTFLAIAEDLVSKNMCQEAVRFYDIVIELDNDKLSERLANATYKRYCIVRNWGMDHAYDSAVQLVGYLNNVTDDKLEAYRKVVACFFVLEKWEKVVLYSEEMAAQAKKLSDRNQYGTAQLYKLRALFYLKKHKEAVVIAEEIIQLLGRESQQYKIWGEGNRYNNLLAGGHTEVIDEFVAWLEENPSEVPAYLHCILDVCIKNDLTERAVDVTRKFHIEMKRFESDPGKDPFERRLLARYLLMSSKVLFSQNKHNEAIDQSLKAMQIFADLGLPNYILNCVKDFHTYKDFCSDAQNTVFGSLLDVAINNMS